MVIHWWSSIRGLICRLYREDPEESVRQCSALLDERSLDAAVRVGDVYALLIEHFTHVGNYQQVTVHNCCGLPSIFKIYTSI